MLRKDTVFPISWSQIAYLVKPRTAWFCHAMKAQCEITSEYFYFKLFTNEFSKIDFLWIQRI